MAFIPADLIIRGFPLENLPMLSDILFGKSALKPVLKSLDASMLRSRTIANNIANVNTPGYRRVEVGFEKELRRALSATRLKGRETSSGHLPVGKKSLSQIAPKAYKPSDPTLPSGVNNVDIDTEMAKLAEMQVMYSLGMRFARGAYTKMNAAIQAKPLPLR